MLKRISVGGLLMTLLAMPAVALVSNGFDSDDLYILNGGANTPTNLLLKHSKLTPLSVEDNWQELGTSSGVAVTGQFLASDFTSLTFSNAQNPGINTPAGYRLFYLGRDELNLPIIQEVDSTNTILREVYVGRVVNGNADFDGATSIISFPTVNLRYNGRNNTLMVGISHNGAATGGVQKMLIYEFSLPDSPAGTGVGSADELQGITLMETYDTGASEADAQSAGANINIAPSGAVYVRNQLTDLFVFANTAGGYNPGGTTSNPTLVVENATLNAVTGQTVIGAEGQWQAAIYRPASNSIVNIQRKTGGNPPSPVFVDFDLDGPTASLIAGTTGIRGQHNGILDAATGDVWVSSQSLPASANGGLWKYSADGSLVHWDALDAEAGGRLEFDVAIPPSGPGACCKPGEGGCESLEQADCATAGGIWQGSGTTCGEGTCAAGSCCLPGDACESRAQADCLAAGGFWQGPGTTCGELPCPLGACCEACNLCEQALPSECLALGGAWQGPFTVCGDTPCPTDLCPVPAADSDCDGDADMEDFARFQRCYTGPAPVDPLGAECNCFDTNGDDVIDDADLTAFIACANGPEVAAGPCP